MPQRAKKLFVPALLTNASVVYYTATNVRAIIKKLTSTNSTGTARLVTIYLGPADATHTITYQKTVLPGQTTEFFEVQNHVLENGDVLAALADVGAAANFMGSGIETDI